ncbi:hypothetical protein ACTU45_23865 [Streptomyces sp. 24-1644]|uniref:hypothetical protein n=1 Tax=Streptomyces sp. 24-1644 TaxID=3457315 RepID=UPI003FA79D56
MPDRRRRTAFRLPLPERAPMMLRERQSSSPGSSPSSGSSGSSPSGSSGADGGASGSTGPQDDNPFAAPPENRPDQPWQPRHPAQTNGGNGDNDDDKPGDSGERPSWGSQWSNQQPGRQNGGFGSRPGGTGPGGQGGGKGGQDGGSGGTRWDPTDPAQRRARYAVLGGMWAFFFALFDFPEIALLLGALSVYWSISALRAKPKSPSSATTHATADDVAGIERPAATGDTSGGAPRGGAAPGTGRVGYGRPQTTAAVSGLVTALLALSIVATTFTVQLVYRDYYTCVNDALTKSGALACNDLLPEPLEPFFGVKK